MQNDLFTGDYPVTEEQGAFFLENGYVRFDDVLNEEELEILRAGVNRARQERKGLVQDLAITEGGNGSQARHDCILLMLKLWEQYPAVRAYVFGERLARMARRLTGSRSVYLYHDQALIKETGPSAPSPWHLDQPYWPSREPGMISCWMAIRIISRQNGIGIVAFGDRSLLSVCMAGGKQREKHTESEEADELFRGFQ